MIYHHKFWSAIDRLSAKQKISLSQMARNAGLDPTCLNKSKRIFPNGKERWLNIATLNKILLTSDTSWKEFTDLAEH